MNVEFSLGSFLTPTQIVKDKNKIASKCHPVKPPTVRGFSITLAKVLKCGIIQVSLKTVGGNMTDDELKKEFKKLQGSIDDVKTEAANKGHFFIILLLFLTLLFLCAIAEKLQVG
jgi:hypothetical protein